MGFFQSRGQRLHYEIHGDGAPVLLIHGFTNHGLAWAPQLSSLIYSGRRAIVPDLAGHGLSQPATTVTSVANLAGDMIALLDHLGIERAVACGLSLGGMVAQQMAVDHAERVSAIIVADSRPSADTPEQVRMVESWVELFERPDGPRRRLESTWPLLVNEAFRTSASGKATFAAWQMVLSRIPGASLSNVARGMRLFNVEKHLPGLRLPTLVIAGEEDRLIPSAASRLTADLVPGARFAVIPGGGHISSLDSPAEFNQLLLGFLASLDA